MDSGDFVITLLIGLVLAALSGTITVLILKGKYGMLIGGILIRILWVVGAIRLAKPRSVWARTFYDQQRLNESSRRFPAPELPAPQSMIAWRPAAPREVHTGVLLLTLGGLVGLTYPFAALAVFVGPLIAFAALAQRGVNWARTTAVALTGILVIATTMLAVVALVATATGAAHTSVLVVIALVHLSLFAGAVTLLYRRHEAVDFYRTCESLQYSASISPGHSGS